MQLPASGHPAAQGSEKPANRGTAGKTCRALRAWTHLSLLFSFLLSMSLSQLFYGIQKEKSLLPSTVSVIKKR